MRSISECWHVIENWLERVHPDGQTVLSPGASDDQVSAIEETLGVDLPESFVAFLRVHDGQATDSRPLLRRFRLSSTESITDEWEQMSGLLEDGTFEGRLDEFDEQFGSPDAEVRDVWWNDAWVPFARDASGNLLCLDLDPSPAGNRGQVIAVWHDAPTRPVRGRSFQSWFADYANAIEDGQLVYTELTHSMMADPDELADLPADSIENPTRGGLLDIYERHYDRLHPDVPREDAPNWFVELCFECGGEVGPKIQFQWGVLNAATLVEDGQLERAVAVFEDEGLQVAETGEVFVTAENPVLDAERAAAVTERLLADVYDVEMTAVVELRERRL